MSDSSRDLCSFYRKILPENIRFNSDGYECVVKLINFHHAERLSYDQLSSSICSYTAPEDIKHWKEVAQQEKAKDMWALGILLYQLFVGMTPYPDVPLRKLAVTIQEKKIDLNHPALDLVSAECKDLIIRLLNSKDMNQRIKIEDAVKHAWFAGNINSRASLVKHKSTNTSFEDKVLEHIRRVYILRKFRRFARVLIFVVRVLKCLKDKVLERQQKDQKLSTEESEPTNSSSEGVLPPSIPMSSSATASVMVNSTSTQDSGNRDDGKVRAKRGFIYLLTALLRSDRKS